MMVNKLRRNCATYEAIDPAIATSFDAQVLRRLIQDAQADIATLSDTCADLLAALKMAENFLSGFEGDDAVTDGKLHQMRQKIADAEGIH